MEPILFTVLGILLLGLGFGAGYVLRRRNTSHLEESARLQAEKLLAEAAARQKDLLLEAKDEILQLRNTAEAEVRERRAEVQRQERRLEQKEQNIDRRLDEVERRGQQLQTAERQLQCRLEEIEQLRLERSEERRVG